MEEFKTPPLKRHPSLMPLSRDHYVGLVQGQHLIEAAGGSSVDRRTAVAEFLDAWNTHIAQHFDDEERLLCPLADDVGRERLLEEHHRLRSMANEAKQQRQKVDPDPKWVHEVGQVLTHHIRWEERDLFPALQSTRSSELDAMRAEADQIEMSRPRSAQGEQRPSTDQKRDHQV